MVDGVNGFKGSETRQGKQRAMMAFDQQPDLFILAMYCLFSLCIWTMQWAGAGRMRVSLLGFSDPGSAGQGWLMKGAACWEGRQEVGREATTRMAAGRTDRVFLV